MSSEDISPFPKRLPEFSRAVDDSEDSDWEDAPPPEGAPPNLQGNCILRLCAEARMEMSDRETGRLDCGTLLVGVGPAACGFLTAFVQGSDARLAGLLCCGFPDTGLANSLGQTALGDFSCSLHRLNCNPQVLICLAMSPVPPADCHSFVSCLLSLLDTESLDVAVLCTQPLSSYQSGVPVSALPSPLLRCLRTSSMVVGKARGRPAPALPELEPPNLLTGLPAELLAVCQMLRVPAVAHVAYLQAALCADADAMAAFRPTLGTEPLRSCRPSWPKDAELVMQQLAALNCTRDAAGAGAALYI